MARRKKTGCGIILLFWIIIFLVLLIIFLQLQDKNKKNRTIFNKIGNIFSKQKTNSTTKKTIKKTIKKQNIKIKLYFVKYIDSLDKLKLEMVERNIKYTDMVLTKAINLLILGPTQKESSEGISSVMPAGVKLLNINIKNNTAYINFNSAFETGVGISMLEARLYQVIYTATQFNGIKRVVFLINGKRKETFSAEGLSIRRPFTRLKKTPIF